jgi:hypothetical protein
MRRLAAATNRRYAATSRRRARHVKLVALRDAGPRFKKHTWPVTCIRVEDPHKFRRR